MNFFKIVLILNLTYTLCLCVETEEEIRTKLRNLKKQLKAKILNDVNKIEESASEDVNLNINVKEIKTRIKNKIFKSLEPVKALQLMMRMRSGVGGTTLITFANDKTFVIKNNILYTCSNLNEDTGKCASDLIKFTPETGEDFCYTKKYSINNDEVCLSKNDLSGLSCPDNNTVLKLSLKEYKELCDDIVGDVYYTYFVDGNDAKRVEIPNKNPHVKCEHAEPGLCEFSGNYHDVEPALFNNVVNNVQ